MNKKRKRSHDPSVDEEEAASYEAMFNEYRESMSNPFFSPLEQLCRRQPLSVTAKVKLLFYLDKVVRKQEIFYVHEYDTAKGTHMHYLTQLHLNAFLFNTFPN